MSTLILSCSTGQGHNSSARAIKEYYDAQGDTCIIEDALGFVSPAVSKLVCWGHVTMYRHLHGLFQIGYHYSEKHSDLFAGNSGIHKLLTLGTDRICKFIQNGHFEQVICTHVFASLMITEVQKRYHLPIKTCLVATDYTCNPGTRESSVDLHFIPDKPLSVYYECPNISDSQIVSSGIPVRQMFYHKTAKAEAKLSFGIPVNHRHLLMMCGSMGCGPMKALTARLSSILPEDADITVVCGTNKALEKSMKKRYAGQDNVHIAGYVENMSRLMDSADLYLTKPGGISVTEASVKNLPMVFIDAVAGCEEYNKIYFIKNQAAKTGETVAELTEICRDLIANPEKLEAMIRRLQSVAQSNAAGIIYKHMKKLPVSTPDEIPCRA